MAVTIRLARGGRKKKPYYRIVACDSRMKRDGRFLEKIGTYNPFTKECNINQESVNKWLRVGAKTSERVAYLLKKHGQKQPVNVEQGSDSDSAHS